MVNVMTDLEVAPAPMDFLALGRRLRHYRQAKGLTLDEIGAAVGRAPESSFAHRKRSTRTQAVPAAGTCDDARRSAPGPACRRAAEPTRCAGDHSRTRAASDRCINHWVCPMSMQVAVFPSKPSEALVGLYEELVRRASEHAATPEEARRANAELRAQMRERGNYYPEIESDPPRRF